MNDPAAANAIEALKGKILQADGFNGLQFYDVVLSTDEPTRCKLPTLKALVVELERLQEIEKAILAGEFG